MGGPVEKIDPLRLERIGAGVTQRQAAFQLRKVREKRGLHFSLKGWEIALGAIENCAISISAEMREDVRTAIRWASAWNVEISEENLAKPKDEQVHPYLELLNG
jgi:hypothetical protein